MTGDIIKKKRFFSFKAMMAIRNSMYATLREHVPLAIFREVRRLDDYRFFNTVISHHFTIFHGQGGW